MDRIYNEPVLNKPIRQLGVGKQFVLICEIAGYNSLGELLRKHTSDLLKLPGFTYHILGEYIDFLELHKLAHYIDLV
jgi:hypothetical protein